MLSKSMRSGDHNSMNKLIGNNLRFIRRLKKILSEAYKSHILGLRSYPLGF